MAINRLNSLVAPAIRVAAAGFGAAIAGPLGGALGGWMGSAIEGSTSKLIQTYAEKFGDSAGEKLLEVGADILADEQASSNLNDVYREALRLGLARVHERTRGRFDDWFVNWNRCLAAQMPLDLPAFDPGRLVPEELDTLFFHTLEILDAQGRSLRKGSTSLNLIVRVIPDELLLELNERLPDYLGEDIHRILLRPEFEQGWKQLQLLFLNHFDETLGSIDRKTDLLPRMAEDVASLLKMATTDTGRTRENPLPELSEDFQGREDELKEILDRVRGHRIVTVTGLGGIGKSEMAKAAARAACSEEWAADGVFYVDLQTATDASLVRSTIISALGLSPKDPLLSQLAGPRLYVFDDLYQALVGDRKGVQDFVRDLYNSTGPSHFLLTSREPIGVIGVENLFPLGRLQKPHDENLFRSVGDGLGYKWQADDQERLTALLEQLDGYPLAIVIAANRLRDVTLETFVRRWQNRHTEALNLPGISADELSKMTSVDFSLVLSFNHLPAGNIRELFALFADLPAGATGQMLESIMGEDVHDHLAYLVTSSLVQRHEDRFTVLVPVREFVSKRRTEMSSLLSRELDKVLLAFAEQWTGEPAVWRTPKRREAFAALSGETLNFYFALARAKARSDNGFISRLTNTLSCFLAVSHEQSVEMLLDGLNASRAIGQTLAEANCLRSLAYLYCGDNGQFESAQKRYEEALILYRGLDNKYGEASCIEGLADLQSLDEHLEPARQHYEKAAALYRAQSEKLGEANCLRKIAELGPTEGPESLEYFQAALVLFRDIGDELGEANCLTRIANIWMGLDNLPEAKKCIEPAKSLFQRLDDKPRKGNFLMMSGFFHMREKNYTLAKEDYQEAEKVFAGMDDIVGNGFCLASFDDMRERISEFLDATVSRGECRRWLGDALLMAGETEEAKKCYIEAIPIAQASPYRDNQEATCHSRLAKLSAEAKDFAGAIGYYEQAAKLFAKAGNSPEEAETLFELGLAQGNLERNEQARTRYERALEIYREIGDNPGQAQCIRETAYLDLNLHDAGKAMGGFKEALALLEGTDPGEDLAATYRGLGETSMEMGQRSDAIVWMEKAAEVYEKIGETELYQQAQSQLTEWRSDEKGLPSA